MGLSHTNFREFDEFGKLVDNVNESLKSIQKAIKVISLGIDYKEFIIFEFLTPEVTLWDEGQLDSYLREKRNWTEANCQFCIEFVIKTALKLQEFDFDISNLKLPENEN